MANDATSVAPTRYLGRRLGEFELGEKIGKGGVGWIYLAEQVGLRRQAIVKILQSRFASDETTKLRFLREARLASTIDHPYAAHVYAFGAEPDGVHWIAMELVRGSTLADVSRAGGMTLRVFVPFLERLCQVVQTAHDHGIVHRDIKPQNVMVIERAGALLPKLLDLGIAKDTTRLVDGTPRARAATLGIESGMRRVGAPRDAADQDGADAPTMQRAPEEPRDPVEAGERSMALLTMAGDVMGSPAYMAPEQWDNADQVDHRCDIYALGVLAYEVVAGRRPFNGTLEELAVDHICSPVPPLPDGVPRELYGVLARAMAKEPDDRHASALELARDLRKASGLEADGAELPRLARDVADVALRDFPQPLAEAVAELEGARSAYQALDATSRLTRVAVRLLAVVALAASARRPGDKTAAAALDASAGELLSALRKRRLEDEEWLELARALVRPFASRAAEHPVPEVVRALHDGATLEAIGALLRHGANRASKRSTERAAAEDLGALMVLAGDLLRALGFLVDHPLAVVAAYGQAELWAGVRRRHRAQAPWMVLPAHLEPGDAFLLLPAGGILPLAPLAIVRKPSPNAEAELFLLEGRGRHGVLLVALPGGFERTSEGARAFLDRVTSSRDDAASDSVMLAKPYRGLSPLTAADADVFFGREREVEAFQNRLRSEALLVVVGPSGAGKSSFVRAGVIPSLRASFHAIVLRPGATPLVTLRARLAHYGVQTEGLTAASDAAEVARRVGRAARARDEVLVVVVDQFEEAFTLTRDPAERRAFCAWLSAMSMSAAEPVRIVLTLRDDFLTAVQEEAAFEQRLAPSLELLATPGPDALRRMLVEPARRAGFRLESDALVDSMVNAVEGRRGALSLLSFAAAKLWEQRDVKARILPAAAYEAMGGVVGGLAQHAEAVLARLTPRERLLVRDAFRRLVTAEGTRATTRQDELLAVLGGGDAARVVLERLVAARLLVVAEADDGTERIEIIHEALLSAWPRLIEWQREDAAGNRLRDQIRDAARQWEERGRARGLLWRDELVEDYRRWRDTHPTGLTASEEAFGAASLRERDRGRRLRAVLMAVLALAAIGTAYVAWRESTARRSAQEATRAAEEANHRAEESTFRARDAARLAAARAHEGDPTTQLALLREMEASEPLPEWAPAARRALHGVLAVVLRHPDEVVTVAFSPDGGHVVSGTAGDGLRVWSADGSGEPLVLHGHTDRVISLAYSPDGKRIASASWDGTVRVWRADGSGAPLVLRHDDRVYAVAFSPDGLRIATGSRDRAVRVWRADGSGAPLVLRGHGDRVVSVAFSPDGTRIASASFDRTIRVWSADGTGTPRVLRGHDDRVQAVSFSPDGARLVSASTDRSVRVWSADGTSPPRVLTGHGDIVYAAKFSPDGARIASSSLDGTVRLWDADAARAREPVVLRGHTLAVYELSFTADGRRLATASEDKTVRVWNIGVAPEPVVLHGGSTANGVAFAPDGKRLAATFEAGLVRVWNVDGVLPPLVLRGHTDGVNGVAFSHDGAHLVTASFDRTVRVWSADGTGSPVVLRGHTEQVNGVAFSPDDRRVASGSQDTTVRVWSADGSGAPVVLHAGAAVNGIGFGADGRRISAGCNDDAARVWSADGSGEPLVLRGHTAVVTAAVLAPDGQRAVTSSIDGTVRVWSLDGGGEPRILRGHTDAVGAVAMSPDGRRIVTGAADKTVRVWTLDGSVAPVVLEGHGEAMTDVAWSPDGARVASASGDKTVRVWSDLAPLAPTDARLWAGTNYCLSVDLRKQLLGASDDVARALHRRCEERVAEARRAVR